MAVATVLAIVGVAAAAVSAGVGIAAAADSADQQKKAAEFNAAVASNNATAEAQKAQFDSDRMRDRNRRLIASQRAAYAKNGLLLSGTALDVERDTAAQGELEVLSRIYSGTMSQRSYEGQAAQSRYAGSRVNTGLMVGSAAASGLSGTANAVSRLPAFRG